MPTLHSHTHCQIAQTDPNLKFLFKLPRGFKIPSTIDTYILDWAVVFEKDKRIYFVAETKGTTNWQALTGLEAMKIKCGSKHFALFKPEGVKYKLAIEASDLY